MDRIFLSPAGTKAGQLGIGSCKISKKAILGVCVHLNEGPALGICKQQAAWSTFDGSLHRQGHNEHQHGSQVTRCMQIDACSQQRLTTPMLLAVRATWHLYISTRRPWRTRQ